MLNKKPRREHRPRVVKSHKIAVEKNYVFSYKEPEMLQNFVSGQGMILSRERTGLTQKQQKQLAVAIKRARHLALLPFVQAA
jgi:small subunit ribosomal protein S18